MIEQKTLVLPLIVYNHLTFSDKEYSWTINKKGWKIARITLRISHLNKFLTTVNIGVK